MEVNKFIRPLLDLKSNSFKFLILAIPPVYGLWLYAISTVIVKNNDIKNYLQFAIILFIGISTIEVISTFIFLFIAETEIFLASILISHFLLLIISIFLTHYTLVFERNFSTNTSYKITFLEYFIRYFLFANRLIGMWSLQTIFNLYPALEIKYINLEE